MNAESSRAHPAAAISRCIGALAFAVRSEPDGIEWKGRLHLVDLAGSERVEKSGVVGEHLREAQARALAT